MSATGVRTVKYLLEVYDSDGENIFQVESAMPFGAISEGDELRADNVAGFAAGMVSGKVKSVKHFLQGSTEKTFMHLIMVHLA
ncbi:hypothetical protein [Methylobacterium iners]|uniref:Uncharacterized protein n=1 Tax=Methylobacterium iners TaxID=418707 RepID=A0ABQ4S6Z2_9HYPH|nr:hypothetical protein [Methylobacterium iners]GJD97892.1 hypothetical protein OCOJLMKI_5131 [Methylobacterium iners]